MIVKLKSKSKNFNYPHSVKQSYFDLRIEIDDCRILKGADLLKR